ncbi:MAG TPA: hypothetical protein VMM12_16285 [Longimicrobiales bacterium]|nr:hypothetical protein [Longimicrobiales bacterium]
MIKSRPDPSYLYTLARPFNKAGGETGDPGGGARPIPGAARNP